MQADSIRSIYFAARGNQARAGELSKCVEGHAIKLGTAWQMEWWLPVRAQRLALLTHDAVAAKQASRALARLAADSPAFAATERVARATYLVLRRNYREALELLDVPEEPLASVGWSANQGLLARVHNQLGNYAEAERVCRNVAAQLQPADMSFVVFTLVAQSELPVALAGQGRFEEAERALQELLSMYHDRGSLVLGWLHRTAAAIAQMKGDLSAAETELSAMEEHYRTIRIPSLLSLCAELRGELRRAEGGSSSPDAPLTVDDSHLLTRFQLALSSHVDNLEQCAQAALKLAVELGAAEQGFIVLEGSTSVVWQGTQPSEQAVSWAKERLQAAQEQGNRTAVLDADELVTDVDTNSFDGMHHSLCLLWKAEGAEEVAVAVLTLASEAGQPAVPPSSVLRVLGERLAGRGALRFRSSTLAANYEQDELNIWTSRSRGAM